MTWQKIETAPKDGRTILGWTGHGVSLMWFSKDIHSKNPKPYWLIP